MSAEIINLRTHRKRKARAARDATAAANRARFGRSKAERDKTTLEQAREERALDGAKRVGPRLVTGGDPPADDGPKDVT